MKKARVNDVIRRIVDNEPWLIVSITTAGFIIVNLTNREQPRPLCVLLPGDYDHWKPDREKEDWSQDNVS